MRYNIKKAIKSFCESNDIKTNFSINRFEIAAQNNRHSTICYYRIRKGLLIYIDYDFLRDTENEMLLVESL